MDHMGSLRVSLLLALGVVPVACGGASTRGDGNGSGGEGNVGAGASTAGTSGKMLPPGTGMVNGTGGTLIGTGGGTIGTGGGTIGIGGGKGTPTCTSPTPSKLTGLVTCAEGYRHRPYRVECSGFGGAPAGEGDGGRAGDAAGYAGDGNGSADPPARPRAPADAELCGDFGQGGGANDCSQYELGFCDVVETGACRSGCYADADCGPGFLCECGHAESPSGGVCVYAANCQVDDDCGFNGMCASGDSTSGERYACLSPLDQCRSSAECPGGHCWFTGKYRACAYPVCGRPFLVESSARVASPVSCSDWANGAARTPHLAQLTSAQRASLSEHWTRMGQMEHASIAAFARFSLQLLALGAPPELVEQCTQALADETAHARLCFELASAYAGRAIGPGPLDVSGSLEASSLAQVLDLVIVEGCYGETAAAVEAREAAELASDPVIVAAYEQIARDEQRHAELAFRFVRWALERDPELVRNRVARALAEGSSATVEQQIVRPCFEALLALPAAA